jgi:carbamoylphosphate synthase small subunit
MSASQAVSSLHLVDTRCMVSSVQQHGTQYDTITTHNQQMVRNNRGNSIGTCAFR